MKGEQMPSDIADKLHAWQFNVSLECSGGSLRAIDKIALGGAVLKLTDLRDVLDWVVGASGGKG